MLQLIDAGTEDNVPDVKFKHRRVSLIVVRVINVCLVLVRIVQKVRPTYDRFRPAVGI